MRNYILSQAAANDLENILEFGIGQFGESKAVEYFDGLVTCFNAIADNPQQFSSVDEIREGYRRCVYKSHAIYFKDADARVLIVRIINGQDLERALGAALTV